MKRFVTIGSSLAFASLLAVLLWSPSSTVQTADEKGDIVLLSCGRGATSFRMTAYQGSTSAPAKKTDNCAQTLSDLAKEGFVIYHIARNEEADMMVYTLTR